jgi:hypothetical protein
MLPVACTLPIIPTLQSVIMNKVKYILFRISLADAQDEGSALDGQKAISLHEQPTSAGFGS